MPPTSHALHQYLCIPLAMAEWIHGGHNNNMVLNWTLEQEHFGFVPSQECQPCSTITVPSYNVARNECFSGMRQSSREPLRERLEKNRNVAAARFMEVPKHRKKETKGESRNHGVDKLRTHPCQPMEKEVKGRFPFPRSVVGCLKTQYEMVLLGVLFDTTAV